MPCRLACCCVSFFVAGCLLSVSGGCSSGPPSGTVEGKVTFEGKPVAEAAIQFQSTETGLAASTRVDNDGSYKLETPLRVGKYTVMISPSNHGKAAKKGFEPKERPDIPAKYRSAGKNELVLTVTAGKNTFAANMTDK